MKCILKLFFFVVLTGYQSLKADNPDSLRAKILNTKVDSTRSKLLIDLGWMMAKEYKWDDAMKSALEARRLAVKANDQKDNANSYMICGYIFKKKGQLEKSLEEYETALAIFKSIRYEKGVIRSLEDIAGSYLSFGKHDLAVKYYEKGIEEAQSYNDTTVICELYSYIGMSFEEAGKFPEALDAHLKVLSLSEKSGDKIGEFYCYNNIAILFKHQRKYKESLEYHLKALKIVTDLKDSSFIAGSCFNIGALYFESKDLKNALLYNNRSIELYSLLHDEESITDSYLNRGSINEASGHIKEALEDYKKAYSFFESHKNEYGLIKAGISLGLLLTKEKDLLNGKKYLDKAYSLTQKLNLKNDLLECYNAYTNYYVVIGNYREAFEYRNKAANLKDSLINESNNEKMLKQQIGFQFEKREEILKAENEKVIAVSAEEKRTKNSIITGISIGLALVLILAIVILRSLMLNKQKNKIITEQKELVEEKQKEILDSLRYAKRIQQSLMPTDKYIEKNIKN